MVVLRRSLAFLISFLTPSSKLVYISSRVMLPQDDVNVILVNWQKAARGQYFRAVSNAELVGRQAGKVLMSMVNMGTDPSDIHVIGFSLGAQVAGFIGETLKSNGLKLGRITGKNHLLRAHSVSTVYSG
jgi:hypothetical protein